MSLETTNSAPDPTGVATWLRALQGDLVAALQAADPQAQTREDTWERPGGGGGRSIVLAEGDLLEKGGVNFSAVHGKELPPAATLQRPQLAGLPFRALGVSVVLHPANPLVPAAHMNVRCFLAGKAAEARLTQDSSSAWWFGGGFDLTPTYPFRADTLLWHESAKALGDPVSPDLYPRHKAACDRYFYLPHRDETRGVGGLFFDDFNERGAATCEAYTRSVGESFGPMWLQIAERRRGMPFGERERQFQLQRRGRYAEFNLLYDRGTRFGLESQGRTESILMSLPPLTRWDYQPDCPEDSPEAKVLPWLRARDWLAGDFPPEPIPDL